MVFLVKVNVFKDSFSFFKRPSEINFSVKDLVNLMYESSLINSGFSLEKPSIFVNRINNMIKLGLNLEDDEEELEPLEEKTDNDKDDTQMEEID